MVPEFHRVSGYENSYPVADFTASGELHPALKTKYSVVFLLPVYDSLVGNATPNFEYLKKKLYKKERMFYDEVKR